MDEHSKDYLLDQAMASVGAFSVAAKTVKGAIEKGKVGENGMNSEQALKYLVEFIEKESNDVFKNYDETLGVNKGGNKKINKS